jgi:mRNA interferase MazF
MTSLKRGDVVLVWFPNSDLTTVKRRPALVVQADDLNTGLNQIVVAMITSNLDRRGHPSRVFFPFPSPIARQAGFRTASVIMTDNLATILSEAIALKLGNISDLAEIDAALKKTLAL